MLGYCDPPLGISEWHEKTERWGDPSSADERRAVVALGAALSTARQTAVAFVVEQHFRVLVETWKDATQNLSSLTKIVSDPSYQAIIDLGKRGCPVVPLILRELKTSGGYWGIALSAITGENPVSAKHIGSPEKVRQDWLIWGNSRGYI